MAAAEGGTSGWRVKLYQLNDDGQWDDRGTGSIRVKHVEAAGGISIHVTQEDNGRDLLQSRISDDRDAYSLQGENIITWEEVSEPRARWAVVGGGGRGRGGGSGGGGGGG